MGLTATDTTQRRVWPGQQKGGAFLGSGEQRQRSRWSAPEATPLFCNLSLQSSL